MLPWLLMDIFFGLLCVYVLILLGIGYYANRDNNEEDYLIAGRNRPAWQVMFSKYAASVAAGWLIVYTSFAYAYGVGILIVFLGSTLGSLLYAFWAAPRIYEVAKKYACYTHSDYVYALTNSRLARTLTNLLVIAMSVLVMMVAAVGGATLLELYSSFSYELALVITIGTVLVYILVSGYKAVMLTDVFQGALLLLLLSVLSWGLFSAHGDAVFSFTEVRNISPLGIGVLGLFGFVSLFADPSRYQVGFAARSSRALSRGMYHTIIPFLYTAFVLYVIGNVMYALDSALAGAEVFPQAIFTYAPAALVPLGLLVFFVAIMSSMDSFIYLIATHMENLLQGRITKQGTRMYILGTSLLIGVLAYCFRDIVDLSVIASALLFSLALPMMYLIWKQEHAHRFVGMTLGGVVGVGVGIAVIGLEPDAGAFVLLGNLLGACVLPKYFKRFA